MILILTMFHNLPPVVEQVANSLSPILYGPNVFVIFFPFPSRIRGLLGGTEKDSWKFFEFWSRLDVDVGEFRKHIC